MITITDMGGIAPLMTPATLADRLAQVANNCVLHKGGVAPLYAATTVATPTKSGTKQSIYKFGDLSSDSQYWFSWTSVVNVARGPIAGTELKTYYTGDGAPKKTNFSLATTGGTDYPFAAYNLGVPAPANAPTLTQVSGTGPALQEERAYVYTNVTGWGEESSPSPAAIGTATSTLVLQLSLFSSVPAGNYNVTARRIYRSVTSSAGTNYYFVGEIPVATATFKDDIGVTSIGEPLATLDWDAPPDDLAGLIALPSGAMCAFSGKQVCFSVVGAPYAWPMKYRLTCDYPVVAVAALGQGVAVLTTGMPYFINTGDPESAQMVRIEEEQACISARSVITHQGTVMYASPDGMVALSPSGCTLLTEKMFDKEAWAAINPTSIFSVKHNHKYYGFQATGGFILDVDGNFTTHDITATAAYVDPVTDQLYVAVGTNIQKWNAGSAKTTTWKSKVYKLPVPTNFSCFQLKAASYANLTLRVYVDGSLSYSVAVTSEKPQRLPSGFLTYQYEFEVVGSDQWYGLAVANSISELKNV